MANPKTRCQKAIEVYGTRSRKIYCVIQQCADDHCRPFSLSDPSYGNFVTECDHEHDLKCELIPSIFEEVESTLNDLSAIDNEEQNEMEYVITQSKKNILAWKDRLLRDINQDEARLNRLRDLDLGAVLVLLDWVMKFLPQKIP